MFEKLDESVKGKVNSTNNSEALVRGKSCKILKESLVRFLTKMALFSKFL